jgi:4-hydroxy-tetrahydrodipicolinate reductase
VSSGAETNAAPEPTLRRLALVGHGRMGRLVESLAPAYGFGVGLRLTGATASGTAGIDARRFAGIDVAVDFSVPKAVAGNVERIAALGIPIVVGTTGWGEDLPRVRAAVERHGVGLLYGANFSVGVQVFYRLAALAAGLLAHDGDYDAWAYEIHHRKKKDAPSGTLLHLKRLMEEAGYARGIDVASNRAGAVPGTHVVGFDAEADTILLEHRARSRDGFARGALRAARWIVGRTGIYEFSDVWSEL